jgi:hypothetical protein
VPLICTLTKSTGGVAEAVSDIGEGVKGREYRSAPDAGNTIL